MADQDWLRPGVPAEAAGTAWTGRAPAQFELRPLSLGEVLDRTFALFKARFWLFAGISMVSASVQVVAQAIALTAAHRLVQQVVFRPGAPGPHPFLWRNVGAAQMGSWVVLLIFFLVSAVTQAATALALTEVYLQRPTSVKAALSAVGRRWYRWIGIALWQVGSAVWVPAAVMVPAVLLLAFGARSGNAALTVIAGILLFAGFFGGVPVGVILYLRNALAVPAAVTEGLPVRSAMRRSKALAAASKGRIFVVLLIASCLYEVVGVMQSPATILMLVAPNQQHYLARGIALVVAFVGHTVVAPVALIGLTLMYFDQRVRKEALDLEILLENARGPVVSHQGPAAVGRGTPEGYAPLG